MNSDALQGARRRPDNNNFIPLTGRTWHVC